MKRQKRSFINIGFTSIIMVFITICLATFATLSVVTANSDFKLSQKFADKTTAYYEADQLAQEMLYELDTALSKHYFACVDEANFFSSLSLDALSFQAMNGIQNLALQTDSSTPSITYEVAISDVQTLYVTLDIHYPTSESDVLLTIDRWQTKTTYDASPEDQPLHLFGTD